MSADVFVKTLCKFLIYKSPPRVGNYFSLPNEIFNMDLCAGEIALYSYLMRMEDRETYSCYPSFKTIGNALRMSRNTVMKYVHSLEEKGLITAEHTSVITQAGIKRNRNDKRFAQRILLRRGQSAHPQRTRRGHPTGEFQKKILQNPQSRRNRNKRLALAPTHLRHPINQRHKGQRRQHQIPHPKASSRPPRSHHLGNHRAILRQARYENAQRDYGRV